MMLLQLLCKEVAQVGINPDHLYSLVQFSTLLFSSCYFNCLSIPSIMCFPRVQWLSLNSCLIVRLCLLTNLRCRKFCISVPWLVPGREAFHSILPWCILWGTVSNMWNLLFYFICYFIYWGDVVEDVVFYITQCSQYKKSCESFLLGLVPGEG